MQYVTSLKFYCFLLNIFILCLGLLRQPKWGHLKDLHATIKLCEPALGAVNSPQYIKLGPKQEVCTNFEIADTTLMVFWVTCGILNYVRVHLLLYSYISRQSYDPVL